MPILPAYCASFDCNLYDAAEHAVVLKNYWTNDKIEQWKDDDISIVNRWMEIFNHRMSYIANINFLQAKTVFIGETQFDD